MTTCRTLSKVTAPLAPSTPSASSRHEHRLAFSAASSPVPQAPSTPSDGGVRGRHTLPDAFNLSTSSRASRRNNDSSTTAAAAAAAWSTPRCVLSMTAGPTSMTGRSERTIPASSPCLGPPVSSAESAALAAAASAQRAVSSALPVGRHTVPQPFQLHNSSSSSSSGGGTEPSVSSAPSTPSRRFGHSSSLISFSAASSPQSSRSSSPSVSLSSQHQNAQLDGGSGPLYTLGTTLRQVLPPAADGAGAPKVSLLH